MDRRQRKTRNAIFKAFIALLSEKPYSQITVEQIIAGADVGRATFYAHFETKDYLLKALCQELFAHVFAAQTAEDDQNQLFACDASGSVFAHLFRHLQNNDNSIFDLLAGQNNELFFGYFRENLKELVKSQLPLFAQRKAPELPESFWLEHVVSVFAETVRWWSANGMKESPETITRYFMLAV